MYWSFGMMVRQLKHSWFICITLLASIGVLCDEARAQTSGGEGQYIVGFEENWSEKLRQAVPGLDQYSDEELKKAVVQGLGAETSLSDNLQIVDAQAAVVPPGEVMDSAYAETLFERGIVSYIEPDYVVHTTEVVPNDAMFSQLYGLKNAANGNYDIDATDAWTKTTGSSDVVVGVIDTGIDWNHPDLSGNIWRNTGEVAGNGVDDDHNGYIDDVYGWNGITNSGNALDDNGHGTHCAGTIGGSGNNSIGVVGVNWDVRLMPLKFLSAGGSGSTSDAIKLIDYAVTMKSRGVNIRVLSNSWGGGGYSQALYDAIERAKNAGMLFVAAAGNSASNNDVSPHYPSSYANTNVISVASTDSAGNMSSFSCYGATSVDIAAPGSAIVSTYPGNQYRSLSGTSMATPHVAGVAALILAARPNFTLNELRDQILSNTRPLPSLAGKIVTGGLVNANLAVPALTGNLAPRITAISNIVLSTRIDFTTVNIQASDPEGSPVTLGASINPAIVGSPNVQLSLSGSVLTINPNAGYTGTFIVEVSASDGQATTRRTFQVEVKNYAPTLAAVGDKVMSYRASSLQVALNAADEENDPITFSASLQTTDGYAYDLDQLYDFYQSGGTYWENFSGLGEKWIRSNRNDYPWFYILADGRLYRSDSNASVLMGNFGASYHTDPGKFINMSAPAAFGGTTSFSGSQLTLTPPSGYRGTFYVKVFATATGGQATQRFAVTVANSTPSLAAIANRSMGRNSILTVPLTATDPDGDPLALTAAVVTSGNTGLVIGMQSAAVQISSGSSYVGTVTIRVRASDGETYAERTFQLTVQNSLPVLTAIPDQVMSPGTQRSLTLSATDSDSDSSSLYYGASVRSVRRLAYELDQRFDIYKWGGNYYEGAAGEGQAERWVRARNEGQPFLIILRNGVVRRWAGSISSSPVVATLTADYYANPTLLFEVSVPPAAGVQTRVIGNQLTLQAANGFAGEVEVAATVSDGQGSNTKTFRVSVRNTARSTPALGTGFDSDGDGISDEQELADGTDPFDRGSLRENLNKDIYTMWNGFLRMTNILEMVNSSETEITVQISFYDINGSLRDYRTINIDPRSQFDGIVNELNGFQQDSYGLIKIEASGRLEGRMTFYREDSQGGFEFAYAVPLGSGTVGKSAVAFNTFQPSLEGSESNYLAANWLSVVNLAPAAHCFTVDTHRADGSLLRTRRLDVAPFGRVDVDGGHGIAGRSVVGLHVITPCDDTSPYLAQIVRYGTRGVSGSGDRGFTFAFPLISRAGTNKTLHVPISRQFGEQTWLEVVNGDDSQSQAIVRFYGANGALRKEQSLQLGANAQVHLDTSSSLSLGEVGSAVIIPQGSSHVLSQAMFYYRSSSNGAMQAMHGIQAEEALGLSKTGSYNRFIGMENWLIIKNPTDAVKSVTIKVNSPQSVAEEVITLAAQASVLLPIHAQERFQAPADTYGTVAIDTSGDPVVAQLIRVRRLGGVIDFAAPTTVR